MRLGLMGDIHGSTAALQMALDCFAGKADRVICTGDVLDETNPSHECLDILQNQRVEIVLGNHDEAWVNTYLCSVPPQVSRRVTQLPRWIKISQIYCVHDHPAMIASVAPADSPHDGEQVKSQEIAEKAFASSAIFRAHPDAIVVTGHAHRPGIYVPGGQALMTLDEVIAIPHGMPAIINPGTVGGKIRSPWGRSCALLDTDSRLCQFFQITIPEQRSQWDDFFDRLS